MTYILGQGWATFSIQEPNFWILKDRTESVLK